ncbi:MAG: restriction endonuclease subunit S [Sphingobacteriales bacterium]|nr:MAG: restriction endonuclease subunit S [Sphingobacteriales bacterium]
MNKLFNFSSLEGKIKIKHGFAFKGEYFASSGDYILLTPGNIYPDGGFKLDEPKEKYYNGEFPKSFLFEKGDLVTVMTDLTQEAIILGGAFIVPLSNKFLHNQRLGKIEIIDIDELDKKFLYYCFNFEFFRGQVRGSASGTTVKHTAPERIYKCKIPLPPLPTQQRIASILSAYDDLIEVNNQRIKLLEQTARELYKEWFVRMRFPGYKQAKFKKGVPENWKTIAISDMVDFKMGQSPKSEFYNEDGNGLPFHQGVGNYGLRFPEHKIFCSVNGRIANEGDVLFSVRAPVGRLNIADRKLIIGRGLAALRHKKGLNSYLFYLLQNEFSKEDLIGNGSIFNSVGKDELKKFKIFDVGDLAKKFNDIVEPIDKQLLVLIQQNTQLRQIRDRLLPRLISGKLEVSEL